MPLGGGEHLASAGLVSMGVGQFSSHQRKNRDLLGDGKAKGKMRDLLQNTKILVKQRSGDMGTGHPVIR